jgi:hypothetical protein
MARGPAKSATTVRPTCIKSDSFFARPPHKWNLREFVAFQYPRCKLQSDPKRRILGAWTGALGKIGICRNYKCRGNSQHRRAAELLMAYHTTVRFNVLWPLLFFWVADSGRASSLHKAYWPGDSFVAPQSGLYVRFGPRVSFGIMGRAGISVRAHQHVRHGLSIRTSGTVLSSPK